MKLNHGAKLSSKHQHPLFPLYLFYIQVCVSACARACVCASEGLYVCFVVFFVRTCVCVCACVYLWEVGVCGGGGCACVRACACSCAYACVRMSAGLTAHFSFDCLLHLPSQALSLPHHHSFSLSRALLCPSRSVKLSLP